MLPTLLTHNPSIAFLSRSYRLKTREEVKLSFLANGHRYHIWKYFGFQHSQAETISFGTRHYLVDWEFVIYIRANLIPRMPVTGAMDRSRVAEHLVGSSLDEKTYHDAEVNQNMSHASFLGVASIGEGTTQQAAADGNAATDM